MATIYVLKKNAANKISVLFLFRPVCVNISPTLAFVSFPIPN